VLTSSKRADGVRPSRKGDPLRFIESPASPGDVLKELYLVPMGLEVTTLAGHLDLSAKSIENLIDGTTKVTPDTAIRLSKAFSTTALYWMQLQMNYDLAVAEKELDVSTIRPLITS